MNIDFSSISAGKIMVIGDVMLDHYLWGSVSRISPEAPVPVVKILDKSQALGGAGNVAANLAGLNSSLLLISVCGADEAGEKLKKELDKKNIGHLLFSDGSRPTITKTRVMAHDRQMLRLDEERPQLLSQELRKKVLAAVRENIKECRAVILSDYGKGLLQTSGLCREIIKTCQEHETPVLVDPKGVDWERYQGATCVSPNSLELKLVSGLADDIDEKTLFAAAKSAKKDFALEWLLLTRGPKGMYLAGPDNAEFTISARASEVYDVSGAGDTVIATLAFGLAVGLSLPEAAELANLAAGVVVGKLGTQPISIAELKSAVLSDMNGSSGNKESSLSAADMLVKAWKSAGEKVVFTNGCFDLLHPGHIHLLHQAKNFGDRLVVGLNSDSSIKRLKGEKRPILSEQDRAGMLGALSCVDLVVLFAEDTPINLIETLQPDVLVKGADYSPEQVVGAQSVTSYGGKVQLVKLLAGFSTTDILHKASSEK